ncbi:unnamed protein product [Penicillium salamii]|nr:unnamed protein product [Penicillium salamii]
MAKREKETPTIRYTPPLPRSTPLYKPKATRLRSHYPLLYFHSSITTKLPLLLSNSSLPHTTRPAALSPGQDARHTIRT